MTLPPLWMIAGPNGAGKRSRTATYFAARVQIVNADVSACERDSTNPGGTEVRIQAGWEAIRRQNTLLAQGA